MDLVALREDWRARAAEHGLGRRELNSLVGRVARREPSSNELRQIAHRLLGPTGLTEKRTAFSAPELVMAWADALAQGARVERIRRLCDRFVAIEGVDEREPDAERVITPLPLNHMNAMAFSGIETEIIQFINAGDVKGATSVAEKHGWLEPGKSGLKRNREREELEAKLTRLNLNIPWR